MTTTRELPRTWTENGVTFHEAFGKRTTFWVNCAACGKRQPAGTETLTAHGGAELTKVERLSHTSWDRPQIGRCNICATRGPLVEIRNYHTEGRRESCGRICLDAHGDQCNCVCQGRDHGAGICTCGKESPRWEK